MRLSVITTNPGKVEEYRSAFSEMDIEMGHRRCTYTEPQVDTLEEVVRFGLHELRSQGLQNFIIDDSGLFVKGLNGFPGVYSAYVERTLGNNGLLKLMGDVQERGASFQCCIGCSLEGHPDIVVSGRCDGMILTETRGHKGFGYDPVFSVDGIRSFAEMETEEKNILSHRGLAIQALVGKIRDLRRD